MDEKKYSREEETRKQMKKKAGRKTKTIRKKSEETKGKVDQEEESE